MVLPSTFYVGVRLNDGHDFREDFFNLSRLAYDASKTEFEACVNIQRIFRGFWTRKYLSKLHAYATVIQKIVRGYQGRMLFDLKLAQHYQDQRLSYYGSKATKMQAIFRGYYSRQYKFDFYARQRYIRSLAIKMDQVRAQLKIVGEEKVRQKELEHENSIRQKLAAFAGSHHHLLGTRFCPGVYAGVTMCLWIDHIDSSLKPSPSGSKASQQLPPPFIQVTEDVLRNSFEVVDWQRNHKHAHQFKEIKESLRKHRRQASVIEEEELRKPVQQGPFLPKYKLEEVKKRPLRPTLRVQTDYYDTISAEREERYLAKARNISDAVFCFNPRPSRQMQSQDSFLEVGTYEEDMKRSFRGMFREPDEPKKFISRKRFATVLPPLH